MEYTLFKTGELANLAGVSLRTIRYYDKQGILKPVTFSKSGYRLYDIHSLENLQKIIMLKYLGFSLEQIKLLMEDDLSENQSDLKSSIRFQKDLVSEKIKHMERMLEALSGMEMVLEKREDAKNIKQSKEQNKMQNNEKQSADIWESLIRIIQLTTEKEEMDKQYRTDENLQKRINIHAYSTAKMDWMEWVYEKLNLQSGMKILEIGCGNGLLWKKNWEKLPSNIQITLTDNSEGMVQKVEHEISGYQKECEERGIKFIFGQMDAEQAQIAEQEYDVIIANHVLYHIHNRDDLFEKISKGLKKGGVFYCSTIGENHMKEINDFIEQFDNNIENTFAGVIKNFNLENGEEQLSKHFRKINLEIRENDLMVDDEEAIYQYAHSYAGSVAKILEKKEASFKSIVRKVIEQQGAFYIHKSQGIFKAYH